MSLQELKLKLANKLFELAAKLEKNDKLQLAINLDISPETIKRYTSGDTKEIRNVELAEDMVAGIEKLLSEKQPA